MPRKPRIASGGHVYHVMNRAAGKRVLFKTPLDFGAFETVMREVWAAQLSMRILAYCLMPTHWHFLLWPVSDTDLPRFVQRLTSIHASRWNVAHQRVGHGAVYQSRYRSIPVSGDKQLLWVWRYVERNALRANLVTRAEHWRWGSLWQRQRQCPFLADGPCTLPPDWTELVNTPQSEAEIEAFRQHLERGMPYGSGQWPEHRDPGRPRTYVSDEQ